MIKFKNLILDILFPRKCLGCGREGNYICHKCDLFLSESLLVCSECGKDSQKGKTHKYCLKDGLDGLISFWDYDGLIKKMLKLEVDDVNLAIVKKMIESIIKDQERFSSLTSFLDNAIISYLPNKRSRFIANYLAKAFKVELVELIDKIKDDSYYDNKKDEIVDKYIVKEEVSSDVLLVDDLFGITLKECAKKLKKSGSKRVWGLVIARGL